MTTPRESASVISVARVVAIALVRARRVVRTRIILAAAILSLLPWLLVDSRSLLTRFSSLAEFTLVGLTAIAAGSLGDDLDSGEYAIVTTHDSSPFDMIAGQAVASLALTVLLLGAGLTIAVGGASVANPIAVAMCVAWLICLLSGWVGLMLLAAAFLEGKANAVAMIGILVIVPVVLGSGILDRLPAGLADPARIALLLLPQPDHATSMFRTILNHAPIRPIAPLTLLVSPFIYFTLAAVRLHRFEPAGRLTQ